MLIEKKKHPSNGLMDHAWRWPVPLYNLYFDSFLLICTSFVVRTRGIVCVVYLLFRLANYKDPRKRCVLAPCLGSTAATIGTH